MQPWVQVQSRELGCSEEGRQLPGLGRGGRLGEGLQDRPQDMVDRSGRMGGGEGTSRTAIWPQSNCLYKTISSKCHLPTPAWGKSAPPSTDSVSAASSQAY